MTCELTLLLQVVGQGYRKKINEQTNKQVQTKLLLTLHSQKPYFVICLLLRPVLELHEKKSF